MQAFAWLGFALGMALLLFTGSLQDTQTPLRMPG